MHLLTPEIVVANPIPEETRIYYSKDEALIKVAGGIGMLYLGGYFLVVDLWLPGFPLILGGIYYLFLKTKILFTSKAQIIISLAGVQTADAPFCTWENIQGVTVSGQWEGRGARPRFEYHYPTGKTNIRVDHLNITPHNLNILINFYQHPWEFKAYDRPSAI